MKISKLYSKDLVRMKAKRGKLSELDGSASGHSKGAALEIIGVAMSRGKEKTTYNCRSSKEADELYNNIKLNVSILNLQHLDCKVDGSEVTVSYNIYYTMDELLQVVAGE